MGAVNAQTLQRAMKTVLITGAAGDVGTHLRRELAGKYSLRLSDRRPLQAGEGRDVHARPTSRRWPTRCAHEGRRRHRPSRRLLGRGPVGGDPRGEHRRLLQRVRGRAPQRREAHPLRRPATTRWASTGATRPSTTASIRKPDSRYGVSKVFGEALGSLYADKYGMEVFMHAHRQRQPAAGRQAAPVDLDQPARPRAARRRSASTIPTSGSRSSTASRTTSAPGTTTRTRTRLGYRPQDDTESYARGNPGEGEAGGDPRAEIYQGGMFRRRGSPESGCRPNEERKK